MLRIITRDFTTSCCAHAVQKMVLGELRKKTGFSLSHCKKALEKFNNDLSQAETWLYTQAQAEGWARATKLQGRAMSQGLIGVLQEKNAASMVEVNCETDFVARTAGFIDMVSTVTRLCHAHSLAGGLLHGPETIPVRSENTDSSNGSKTIADLVATNIGSIGENMRVRRGEHYVGKDGMKVGSYVHTSGGTPSGPVSFGRYAALVLYSGPDDIGTALAQHVVGMSPKCIGPIPNPTEKPQISESSHQDTVNETVSETSSAMSEGESNLEETEVTKQAPEPEEVRLLHQEFLLDSEISVHEYLQEHKAHIQDFVRYECGEELDT